MNVVPKESKAKTLEQVLIKGDLSSLTEEQRVQYYMAVCESVGLNHLTKPFDYLELNKKLVLYAKRDATDQLRKLHNVSITITSRELQGDIYVVTAQATMGNRTDESVGAVVLGKSYGDAKANLVMKAETKAKRRVTLSICGLGLLDEIEVADIPQTTNNAPPAQTSQESQGNKTQPRASQNTVGYDKRRAEKMAEPATEKQLNEMKRLGDEMGMSAEERLHFLEERGLGTELTKQEASDCITDLMDIQSGRAT